LGDDSSRYCTTGDGNELLFLHLLIGHAPGTPRRSYFVGNNSGYVYYVQLGGGGLPGTGLPLCTWDQRPEWKFGNIVRACTTLSAAVHASSPRVTRAAAAPLCVLHPAWLIVAA